MAGERRIERINRLIKEELGKIIRKEVDFPKNILVTVTRVETSQNLMQAKIFVSFIPETQNTYHLSILNKNLSFLQRKIGEKLQTKIIPKIKFIEERGTKEAAKIEELLEEIKKNNKTAS